MSEFYNRQNCSTCGYMTLGTYNSAAASTPVPTSASMSGRKVAVPTFGGQGYAPQFPRALPTTNRNLNEFDPLAKGNTKHHAYHNC